MTSEEFAKKYAGRRLSLKINSKLPYRSDERVVIGYAPKEDRLIVKRRFGGGVGDPAIKGHVITAPHLITDDINWVKGDIEDYDLIIEPSCISRVLYPSICKKCNQPARRIDNIYLCSNTKCKTRNKVFKSYKKLPPVYKYGSKENPINMVCPSCGGRVVYVSNADVGKVLCEIDHIWYSYTFRNNMWYKYGVNNDQIVQSLGSKQWKYK
jgi:hypothetical protein